jgi:hypothetical protein
LYRQTAVAISKKHIPELIQPFDPNSPTDYNGFLHLLSFQTGHNPSTHVGAYALDHAYPAKLQPELVERYFQNSVVWHKFLAIAENDSPSVDVNLDADRPCYSGSSQLLSYPPDTCSQMLPTTVQKVDISDSDQSTSSISELREMRGVFTALKSLKPKEAESARLDSSLKKIKLMRQELQKMEHEFANVR